MTRVEIIRVFLASPGDVAEERTLVPKVLDSINRTLGKEKGIRFEMVSWETDSVPSYGQDAQAILNDQIGDMTNIDLFIGIMWNRFGSITPRAESGTEEEFRRAVTSLHETGRPAIMFYFNRSPFDACSSDEAEQKLKVLKFKEDMQENGLTQDYRTREDFSELFRSHIEKWLMQNRPLTPSLSETDVKSEQKDSRLDQRSSQSKGTRATSSLTVEVVNNSGMWVLLGAKFFLASDVSELGDRRITTKIPVLHADEDAFFRALEPSPYGRREIIPFAHQHSGGLAKIVDTKRNSSGVTSSWELTLELEQLDTGFGSEMAYGGFSTDQIATMRARLILLNEKPSAHSKSEDPFFRTFLTGIGSPVKATASALPLLWKEAKGDADVFLPLARLWSIFHLITTNTCEYVLELTLGPIKNGKMHVRFRGQRRKMYSNVDRFIIEFDGDCDLNAN